MIFGSLVCSFNGNCLLLTILGTHTTRFVTVSQSANLGGEYKHERVGHEFNWIKKSIREISGNIV